MNGGFDWRALPFDQWPDIDRHRWQAARHIDEDALDERRPAASWRPSSAELFCRCYGIWLAWLQSRGHLDATQSPENSLTRARVRAYMQALRDRGSLPKTLYNHAASLRHMAEALAPDCDWRWMHPLVARLQVLGKSTRNHSDLPPIRELFELGLMLLKWAEDKPGLSPKQRALAFRNGLAIAVLAARPFMRRENLARICLGQHLVEDGPVYRLRFSGDEMKGRRARGGPLPLILSGPISRYLAGHRPTLLGKRSDEEGTVFISGLGRPITPHNLSDIIGKITQAVFGRRITAHEFRHAAGSSIAREDPAHVGIVTTILGHADFRTSESFYIFAREHDAFRSLDAALTELEGSEAQGS